MPLEPHPQIWKAIKQRRMMRLIYHGKLRIIEPHDHGILNGSVQLLAWQVHGASSRPLPNWILMKVDEMVDLTTLAETFPGGRPTGSGRHKKWDKLFIRVEPTEEHCQFADDGLPVSNDKRKKPLTAAERSARARKAARGKVGPAKRRKKNAARFGAG